MLRTYSIALALFVVGVIACSLHVPGALAQPTGSTVTIPGDAYLPATIMINAGQTVTWVNKDTDPHVTTSAPGAPVQFTLVHQPGKSVTFHFTAPGIYSYFCLDHATFNASLRRAAARKEADTFPVAMEGLIVVKGPGLTEHSSATVTISGGLFGPYIAVVNAGGKVTWTNNDRVTHAAVFVSPGIPKLTLAADKSGSITFAKSGIYFYYDEHFATYNPKLGLAAAKKGASHFPIAVQGYVVVL